MKKSVLVFALALFACTAYSQIEIAKIISDKKWEYKLGFGAFLKFDYPISDNADVSLEIGAKFWADKSENGDGIAVVPLKVGYRYVFGDDATGFYLEPQLGYNFYQADDNEDSPHKGLVWSVGTGYQLPPLGGTHFDIGIKYESVVYSGGPTNYVSLRLSHTFSLKKRESEW